MAPKYLILKELFFKALHYIAISKYTRQPVNSHTLFKDSLFLLVFRSPVGSLTLTLEVSTKGYNKLRVWIRVMD